MDKKVKALWLEALDKEKQATGCLHNVSEDSYCCLGVLTKCYLEQKKKDWLDISDYCVQEECYGEGEVLPLKVRRWAKLTQTDPFLRVQGPNGESTPRNISCLNDDMGYTFAQLKELIEEQL